MFYKRLPLIVPHWQYNTWFSQHFKFLMYNSSLQEALQAWLEFRAQSGFQEFFLDFFKSTYSFPNFPHSYASCGRKVSNPLTKGINLTQISVDDATRREVNKSSFCISLLKKAHLFPISTSLTGYLLSTFMLFQYC